MIFTRYYAWIPKATRSDGSAFMGQFGDSKQKGRPTEGKKRGKVIRLFDKDVPKTSHPTKKVHGKLRKPLDFLGSGGRI